MPPIFYTPKTKSSSFQFEIKKNQTVPKEGINYIYSGLIECVTENFDAP